MPEKSCDNCANCCTIEYKWFYCCKPGHKGLVSLENLDGCCDNWVQGSEEEYDQHESLREKLKALKK